MRVELIYERTCPNVGAARARLMQAFHRAKLPASWREWEVGDASAPSYARRCGSPTILVDGKDVAGHAGNANASSCRLYPSKVGLEGVPPVEQIAAALGRGAASRGVPHLGLGTLPSVGVALLPKLTCALCWPAYTALLTSLGIGFIDYTPYLFPTIAILLVITLATLAYRAPSRHGYGPFWLGALGGGAVLIGKFAAASDLALYGGAALLVGAAVWNIWPRRLRLPWRPLTTR